eukprot:4205792-Pyramimonas_sp.AAC.1
MHIGLALSIEGVKGGGPGRGGLQGTGPRAGQLGGLASRGLRVCPGVRPSPHTTPILPPLFHFTCWRVGPRLACSPPSFPRRSPGMVAQGDAGAGGSSVWSRWADAAAPAPLLAAIVDLLCAPTASPDKGVPYKGENTLHILTSFYGTVLLMCQ